MRNVKQIISAWITMLAVMVILPMSVLNAGAAENMHKGWDGNSGKSGLWDGAGLYDSSEYMEISELISRYSQKLEMNIFIYIGGKNDRMSDAQTQVFSDHYYENTFGQYTDGIFYFMDFTGKSPAYDYMFMSGRAVLQYDSHRDSIFNYLDNWLPSSGKEDYSVYKDDIRDAIEAFLERLDYYSDASPKDNYYDSGNGEYYYYKGKELYITSAMPVSYRLRPLVFAVPIGIIAAVIYYFVMKSTYKFKPSANPSVYVSSEETRFKRREDRFIRTYTTKTKIESSSSGGGGGGGHSGGGHGSGGGHHR